MTKVAVLGAGGKMGYRVSNNLKGSSYDVSHIEVSEAGRNRLKELSITCVDADVALPQADVVILAIPDNFITGIGNAGERMLILIDIESLMASPAMGLVSAAG